MTWQRARTPENINERRETILEAAKEMFRKNEYDKISFNGIAVEAGFTKSNVYRYFSSREEIFLSIYSELITKWSEALLKYYKKLEVDVDYQVFAKGIVDLSLKHKPFLDLSSLLFISLERNSSEEQLREFKKLTVNLFTEHTKELQRLYPELTFEDVFSFLRMMHVTISTLWASGNPNESLKKIYKEEEFKAIAPDFKKECEQAIFFSIRGILAKD